MFTYIIHHFNLRYHGVKSNNVKIRQEYKVVDFKISTARDHNQM